MSATDEHFPLLPGIVQALAGIKDPSDRQRLLNALIANEGSADDLEFVFHVMDSPLSASTIKKWRRANAAWKELRGGQSGTG